MNMNMNTQEEQNQNKNVYSNSMPLHIFNPGATRGQVIDYLMQKTAKSSQNIPIVFYRSDLLPDWRGGLSDEDLVNCTIQINYREVFAAFPDGKPIWSRMPHEPLECYELFRMYLEQLQDMGIRQIFKLTQKCKYSLEVLQDISKEYYWQSRAQANDIYEEAAHQSFRLNRIKKTENNHFKIAEDMMQRIILQLQNPEYLETLTAKEAFTVLNDLVKIQRMSLGLSGQGGSPTVMNIDPGTSLSAIVRTVAQVQSVGSEQVNSTLSRLDQILGSDPKVAQMAQEVILKLNEPSDNINRGNMGHLED